MNSLTVDFSGNIYLLFPVFLSQKVHMTLRLSFTISFVLFCVPLDFVCLTQFSCAK